METYSIFTDFGNVQPNISQLDEEIRNSSITTNFNGISSYEDEVIIYFNSSLSGPEKTVLDGIIASHIPIFIPSTDNKLVISISQNSRKSSYVRVSTCIFPGSTYATAKCISYMDSDVTSYDIKIYNKDTRQTLLETNLTNTSESIQDLGILSNVPTFSQIEISIRKNGGNSSSKVYIESVTIFYH